ncbi:hypothetical protein N431DRAFT_425329 [Stipitochalara longipes BDJ]|nr:hypothetical protein N431DRAFT_425329 [Stipitochalara longipes BDJ]
MRATRPKLHLTCSPTASHPSPGGPCPALPGHNGSTDSDLVLSCIMQGFVVGSLLADVRTV